MEREDHTWQGQLRLELPGKEVGRGARMSIPPSAQRLKLRLRVEGPPLFRQDAPPKNLSSKA